jgi:2-oxoisovalerate dehydrogenase E1 component
MATEGGILPDLLAPGDLTAEQLVEAYRLMYLARRLDDREITLKRRNQVYFQISGAGHEAIQAAAGMVLRPRSDWFYPYYRDRALCLALGVTPLEMLLQAVGADADPASGGRQMPSHWSNPELHIVTSSSPTGTQFLQAVGCAEASRRMADQNSAGGETVSEPQVVLVCGGDGSTSEGEFWEALNAACLERLPLLFLIEDNDYAISVPIEAQTAGGSISRLVRSFPHLKVDEVDGLDFRASYRAMRAAVEHCRSGEGPALLHAHVVRLYAHSLSDDETLYKTPRERESDAARDPIRQLARVLEGEGIADEHAIFSLHHEIDLEVQQAADQALEAPPPKPGSALKFLYSPTLDPAGPDFHSEPYLSGEPRTMLDLINGCLHAELRRDPRILVFGEDVADCTREENLAVVKGKGGVFKATAGLQRAFGSRRVFNSPLAEAGIVGRAIGLATRGFKPVVEIQFFDYIWPAMMQIRDELANIRWRSNNGFSSPLVIRVPIGGYLGGGAIYHSQSGEVLFTHIPGLRVVFPSNALDAAGLLRTSIRCDDPVLFLEHKKLYRETYNRSPDPGPDYMIPFGSAQMVREGSDVTIVTYGALVHRAQQVAARLEKKHAVSVEILDLRTLSPYDWKAIERSVKKTSRVLVAYEDCRSFGYGAEIAARIADELFTHLDAPVGRIGALDTWVAYHPRLEKEILPQVEDIEHEVERLLKY